MHSARYAPRVACAIDKPPISGYYPHHWWGMLEQYRNLTTALGHLLQKKTQETAYVAVFCCPRFSLPHFALSVLSLCSKAAYALNANNALPTTPLSRQPKSTAEIVQAPTILVGAHFE